MFPGPVNRSALLIEEEDYQRLSGVLDRFADFQVGKETLIDMRLEQERHQVADEAPKPNIVNVIQQNEKSNRNLIRLLRNFVFHFAYKFQDVAVWMKWNTNE